MEYVCTVHSFVYVYLCVHYTIVLTQVMNYRQHTHIIKIIDIATCVWESQHSDSIPKLPLIIIVFVLFLLMMANSIC